MHSVRKMNYVIEPTTMKVVLVSHCEKFKRMFRAGEIAQGESHLLLNLMT